MSIRSVMVVVVASRVGVTRRELGWDRVLVVTIWHGEGTSRDNSLLFLALILGFSDRVARRVSCILLFMPVNSPAETFPATVLYS